MEAVELNQDKYIRTSSGVFRLSDGWVQIDEFLLTIDSPRECIEWLGGIRRWTPSACNAVQKLDDFSNLPSDTPVFDCNQFGCFAHPDVIALMIHECNLIGSRSHWKNIAEDYIILLQSKNEIPAGVTSSAIFFHNYVMKVANYFEWSDILSTSIFGSKKCTLRKKLMRFCGSILKLYTF